MHDLALRSEQDQRIGSAKLLQNFTYPIITRITRTAETLIDNGL